MYKGYKIRLYPTKEQENMMWQHIHSCRYVWNYMLSKQEELYGAGEKHLSGFSMIKMLTPLKKDGAHDWLYNVSNRSLQILCQDLDAAYKRFFDKTSGFPKYKSRKRSKNAFPVRETFYFKDGKAVVEKIGKVKYKTDFYLPQGRGKGKFANSRISYENGKWMLSFSMECENQAYTLTDKSVGIDLGIKELAVVAHRDEHMVFHNINKSKKVRDLNKRIKHLQRNVSRKYEANRKGKKYVKTNNIVREEERLSKMRARLSNIRSNYTHQTTHKIVSLLPSRVVMEDLNVSGMMKNKHLSKAVQEQCFYEFIRQMQYKCDWRGIEFVQADRFYPSSKTCSCCGCMKKDLKLSDRTFKCPECGYEVDRDYNAAVNLMRYVA